MGKGTNTSLDTFTEKTIFNFLPIIFCPHSVMFFYEVTRSSNTIRVQPQMINIKHSILNILSKDTPSFQRRDWLKRWKAQWGWNSMQHEQNQIWSMWMRWTMSVKWMRWKWMKKLMSWTLVHEMNRWTLINEMNDVKVTR